MADALLNPQQQRFVLAILSGQSEAEAYKAARFPRGGRSAAGEIKHHSAQTEAKKWMKVPAVADALASAQERALALAGTNLASLVADLQEARAVALSSDPPQTNGAVAASMGIAKLLGLVVDKAKVEVVAHKPAFNSSAIELSEDEWKRQFALPAGGKQVGKTAGR